MSQKLNAIGKTAFVHQGLYGDPGFAGTDKQQDGIVAALYDLSKNIDQKRMVLLSSKTPHMPNGKLVADEAQVGSRLRASLRIEAKAIQIDCVVYDLKFSNLTKQPLACISTTSESVRRVAIGLSFKHCLKNILGVFTFAARRVAMCYANRDASLLSRTKRKYRKRVNMAMHNLPAFLFKEVLKLSLIFNYMLIGRNIKHPTTKRFNLFTRNERRIGIDKKVKLHFAAIDMAVVIHDDGLNATANHLAYNLSHSNGFGHLTRTASGQNLNHSEDNDF